MTDDKPGVVGREAEPTCQGCVNYYTVAEQLHYDAPYCRYGYVACLSQNYRFYEPKGADE